MTNHKGIIAWFAQNSVAANLLMVSLIILGLVSMGDIRKEAFEQFLEVLKECFSGGRGELKG